MKFNIQLKLVFSLLFEISISSCSFNQGGLPAEWYLLPEDGGPKSSENLTPLDLTLIRNADDLLDAHLASLIRTDEMPVPTPPPGRRLGDDLPWRLGAFVGDLSISSNGVLGNLIWGGSPAVQIVWAKNSVQLSHQEISRILQGTASIQLSRNTSREDQRRQIESVIQSTLASGWIRDEAALRRTLLSSMDRMQAIGAILDRLSTNSAWRATSFRLPVTVDASGNISSNHTVGTQLTFKMEWIRKEMPTMTLSSFTHEEDSEFSLRLKQNFIEFVNHASQDIQEISLAARSYQGTGYDPSMLVLGVAVTAEGDIGVAKGGVKLWGQITFEPIKNAENIDLSGEEGYFPVIASEVNTDWMRYSEKERISFQRVNERGGQPHTIVYKVDRRKIRRGFKRAAQLGEFFARRAEISKKRDWNVQYVSLKLDVSLSGMTALTSVMQSGEVDLILKKRNF